MKQKIPNELPLVNRFVSTYGNTSIFSGVNLIFAQHLVGDFIPFLRAMIAMGADKSSCWFLDIPYASNQTVKESIIKLGFSEDNFAPNATLGALDPYESTQYFRTVNLFREAISSGIHKGCRKTVVIDDGGHIALARYAIKPMLSSSSHHIHIIEQTGYGIKLNKRLGIMTQFPIINIAESDAKMRFETPVIARSSLARLESVLTEENVVIDQNDRILVVGYGNVGKAITKSLISEWAIRPEQITIKPDPSESFFRIDAEGHLSPIVLSELIGSHRLVLGCSGERAFHHSHLPLLTNISILASVSSWSLEFPKDDWVAASQSPRERNVRLLDSDTDNLSHSVHRSLHFALNGQTVILANAGYPVNFWGGVNTSPPEFMQLTVTMMLAGAVQAAMRNSNPGDLSLNPSVEEWITRTYQLAQSEPVIYAEG